MHAFLSLQLGPSMYFYVCAHLPRSHRIQASHGHETESAYLYAAFGLSTYFGTIFEQHAPFASPLAETRNVWHQACRRHTSKGTRNYSRNYMNLPSTGEKIPVTVSRYPSVNAFFRVSLLCPFVHIPKCNDILNACIREPCTSCLFCSEFQMSCMHTYGAKTGKQKL